MLTIVTVHDQPGPGGAHHHYRISPMGADGEPSEPPGRFGIVRFQEGGVVEAGVNGATHEDLLGIVLHRLRSFQDGAFPCDENAMAIQHIEGAMMWLQFRTAKRQEQGVEGVSVAHDVQPHESMVSLGDQPGAA